MCLMFCNLLWDTDFGDVGSKDILVYYCSGNYRDAHTLIG